MDGDDDFDTHICLRCKETIVGLDNYVHHKKVTCSALQGKTVSSTAPSISSKDPVEDSRSLKPGSPTPDDVLKTLPKVSVRLEQLQTKDFFLSLELQSNKAKGKSDVVEVSHKQESSGEDSDSKQEESFEEEEGTGKKCYAVGQSSAVYEDDSDDQRDASLLCDEELSDSSCPPSDHTGGKWKPESPNAESAADDHRYVAKNTPVSNGVRADDADGVHACHPCDLATASEEELLEHLTTQSHWRKSRSDPKGAEALASKYSARLARRAPFHCAVCHFFCASLDQLDEHWSRNPTEHRKRVGQGSYLCTECAVKFVTLTKVMKHVQGPDHVNGGSDSSPPRVISMCSDKGPLRCPLCTYVARTGKAFVAHVRWRHKHDLEPSVKLKKTFLLEHGGGGDLRPCRHCEFVATSPSALKDHVAGQHANKMFQCKLCPAAFTYPSVLTRHQERHKQGRCLRRPRQVPSVKEAVVRESADGQYGCSSCPFRSDTNAKVLYHETRHSKPVVVKQEAKSAALGGGRPKSLWNAIKLYKCPLCEKLMRRMMLYCHLLDHTGEKPHTCSLCGVAFSRASSLYSHGRSVHGGRDLACPHCDYKTFTKVKLLSHVETHSNNRPRAFLCDMCGSNFLNSHSLRHHRKLHFGDKKHQCSFEGCGRSYRSWSELEVHLRVHTNERPFLCTHCGYAAKTRHQLTKHERSHTGERPFKCPHCPYAAALSAQLWRHLRIHTGARPYSCPHCSYTCNTSENLRKHVLKSKKHQGLNVYVCPHCSFGCDLVRELQDHVVEKHRETIGDLADLSPTYISLLAGVYDRNASKGEVVRDPVGDGAPPCKKRARRTQKAATKKPRMSKVQEEDRDRELAMAERQLLESVGRNAAAGDENLTTLSEGQSLVAESEGQPVTSDEPLVVPDVRLFTSDGHFITPDGELFAPEGHLITPEGHLITPDGHLVTSDGQLIASDGQQTFDEHQTSSEGQLITSDEQQTSASDEQVTASEEQMQTDEELAPTEDDVLASEEQYATAEEPIINIAVNDSELDEDNFISLALIDDDGNFHGESDSATGAFLLPVSSMDGETRLLSLNSDILAAAAASSDDSKSGEGLNGGNTILIYVPM